MKKNVFLLCLISLFVFSCKEDTDHLNNEIENLQHVVSLHNAYIAQKIVVSATSTTINSTDYWNITFSDNSTMQLPKSVVISIDLNETTDEYTFVLYNSQQLVFNRQAIIRPTGVAALTQHIALLRNMEVGIEFRVNPSNAVFNYDVSSPDCQIALDMIDRVTTYSYVTEPERFRLTRIEQAVDANGKVKEGQYVAYIADNGTYVGFKYTSALVLSTKDQQGNDIQLSSAAFTLERKKDTGLPIVIIRTENKTEIKDKENWITATINIDGAGKFPRYAGMASIRGRGNSTWNWAKKPYSLKLDVESEILGMPAHKHWVLLANYIDRTLIRNHIAFEIARRTGLDWTVRGQFVEVVLNDHHIGNYYLCEQVKPGENRVNITEMTADDLDEESITGGYLLEFDTYYDEVNKFRSAIFDLPVMFKEPDEEKLQPEQFEYMQNYINRFEELLMAPNFAQTRAYASMIADTTFIDWWFVMELTANYEARYPKSAYFYKDRNDVLKAGPVWDFDWGTFTNSRVTGFYVRNEFYFAQLFKDPVFVGKVKERWERFKPQFDEITEVILQVGLPLHNSSELNDEMWSLKNFNNINEDNAYSFDDAINRMSRIYENRLNWLDGQIRMMR